MQDKAVSISVPDFLRNGQRISDNVSQGFFFSDPKFLGKSEKGENTTLYLRIL